MRATRLGNAPMNGPKHALPRVVGPWIGLAVVVGTVIGSGVFLKPRIIAQNVPDFMIVAFVWIFGGVFTLLGTLAIAEVSVLFPLAGGNYVFLREGFGRLAGFLWGWVEFWMIKAASIAALATAFVQSLHGVVNSFRGSDAAWLSPLMSVTLTIGVIVVLAAVNIRGVRWGGGLQLAITLVKVLSLLAILVLPFALLGFRDPAGIRASLLDQPPSAPFSLAGLGEAFLGVLWAYHGWLNIAPLAGEVVRPQRNLPIAFIGGIGIVIFLYLGANLAYCLTLSLQEMAALPDNKIVAGVFGERLLGPTGAVLALAAIMISTFGALNGNLLAGPRLPFAMADDGLAPRWLSAVHPRFQTPAAAIAALAIWSITLIVIGAWAQGQLGLKRSLFDLMTDFAMFGAVIFETLGVATIFIFRRRMPDAERPYRCPGYPWVPLIYLGLPIYVLIATIINQPMQAMAGLVFIQVGALVYWYWHVWRKGNGVVSSEDAIQRMK
jgi:APA family basic amino acid/polyamine antiporter